MKSNNVKIGNINVPVFYYWLSTQVNVKRFLLGNDFIHFCDYEHKYYEGSVVISNFFYNDYIKQAEKIAQSFNQDEILELSDTEDLNLTNFESSSKLNSDSCKSFTAEISAF